MQFDPDSPDPVEVREHIMHPKLLLEVDVTRNSLTELILDENTMWSTFDKLQVFKAPFNQIEKVRIELNKLAKLVLSNNKLVALPELETMPSLEELDLARNLITEESWEEIDKISPKISFLDLSGNKLAWKAEDFLGSLQYLRACKRMKMFYIQDNPFIDNFRHRDTGELLD